MDRGYNDYALFSWLTRRGTTFVTRLKDSAVTTSILEGMRAENSIAGWSDAKFCFDSVKGREACGDLEFRLINWYDSASEQHYRFITNDFDLTPEELATLYRERWQIELFFKKLKQNLKIKSFIGTSRNAVLCQIWTAAIMTLVVELIRNRADYPWSFSRLMTFLRMNLLTHKHLEEWIHRPDFRDVLVQDKVPKPPAQLSLFA